MWTYDDSRAAVRDVLRLSRAMTFKNAVAGLPLGGGKGVIMLRPDEAVLTPERREAALQDFGDTVESLGGDYLTAEDVGTSESAMDVIATRTQYVTGLASGSGDPSPWTALGCEVALRTTCEHAFGTSDLSGRTVAVIGLGSVGGRLAELLHAGGAELVVADVDQSKRELAERLGATWTDPHSAMTAEVDVLAPCALGGVLNDDTVPALRCKAIAGAANNQLASDAAGRRPRRARHPVGAGLRLQRRRHHQHRRRARARRLPTDRADTNVRPSATRCARSSTARRRAAPRRCAPRSSWAASGSAPPRAARPRSRCAGEPAAAFDRPRRGPSRSFSRCAFSVIAANGRTAAGASAHAASSSASSSSARCRIPARPASLRSRSARWARYSSSFASGSSIRSPCPGWMRSSPRARSRSSPSRYSLSRLLTNTLPSPSTVSPVKA